jgi:ketosteroid isomerase-like protein
MSAEENIAVMRQIFEAIEHRDLPRMLELTDPQAEFHWPPPLPYAGVRRGLAAPGPSWEGAWIPLQPTATEQRLDPRVIAANENEVVILWRQRGLSPRGDRYDGEVLALYRLRDRRLLRAQMFYFDVVGAAEFLARAADTSDKQQHP